MIYVNAFTALNALGNTADEIFRSIIAGQCGITMESRIFRDAEFPVAEIQTLDEHLPDKIESFRNRCCAIAFACLNRLSGMIDILKQQYSPSRIGMVCATSASGTNEVERQWRDNGDFRIDYHHTHIFQSVAKCLQTYFDLQGPVFSVSTACSSSANAMKSAMHLLNSGICDAVITGGVDALCNTTYYGFQSLQIMDSTPCKPFDRNRKGLSLGEGAAFFILSRDRNALHREDDALKVCGIGTSSDAYHMTAPDPDGRGARMAMLKALDAAGISASDVDYINLHGTGTPLNDLVESQSVQRIFGSETPCSSTKGYTGHLLGAAAAVESAICLKVLQTGILPANLNLTDPDPEIEINLVTASTRKSRIYFVLNNSFAFGGNNTSIVFGV